MKNILAEWPAVSFELPSGQGSRLERISSGVGEDYFAVTFDDSANEQAIVTLPRLPDSYQGGSMSLVVTYVPPGSTSGNSAPFLVAVEALTPGTDGINALGDFDTGNTMFLSGHSSSNQVRTGGSSLTNADSAATGDRIRIKITRNISGGGNTLSGDIKILGVTLYEEITEHEISLPINSSVTTGTAPLTIASTTACTNLNADLLDGEHSTAFARAASICDGRLTTETGVPVSSSDQTAKSTLYFTPFRGNGIGLYDGSKWNYHTFTERSLALSSLTSGKNYDVFLYNNSGTLTLELSAAWTNDTTRADALATQDGVYVKSGSTTRRWLGTIRTTSTSTTEDSRAKRFVWNAYHQWQRELYKDCGANHSYNGDTERAWGNDATNTIAMVAGIAQGIVVSGTAVIISGTAATYGSSVAGVGSNGGGIGAGFDVSAGLTMGGGFAVPHAARVGYSYVTGLERGSGGSGTTFWSLRFGSTMLG